MTEYRVTTKLNKPIISMEDVWLVIDYVREVNTQSFGLFALLILHPDMQSLTLKTRDIPEDCATRMEERMELCGCEEIRVANEAEV